MLPRFVFLAGTTIIVAVLLILTAAYVSFSIFRNEIVLRQEPKPHPAPRLSATASSIETAHANVSNLYTGSHIIIVCSELEAGQKSQTNCPD